MERISDAERLYRALKSILLGCGQPIEVLLRRSDLVDSQTDQDIGRVTPLLVTCFFAASEQYMGLLIEFGADLSATGHMFRRPTLRFQKGGYGSSDFVFPLFEATREPRLVDFLLKKGASVHQINAIGQSALHAASTNFFWPSLEALIEHGADVNLQDHNGRTPLHYACECNNQDNVKILLDNGADCTLRDNNGFNVLDVAANSSYELMQILWTKSKWAPEEIIEAYETVALTRSCPSPYGCLLKATLMRIEHGLPKTVKTPLECYSNTKEWETEEEIEKYKTDPMQLRLQCILARERIFSGRYMYLVPVCKYIQDCIGSPSTAVNALLRHYLELFRKNDDYLYFTEILCSSEAPLITKLLRQDPNFLETDTITAIMDTAMESLHKLHEAKERETKVGCLYQLTGEVEDCIIILGAFIRLLLKRTPTAETLDGKVLDKDLATSYLQQLLKTFPFVSSAVPQYCIPLPHILLNHKNHRNVVAGLLPDFGLMKLVLKVGFDVNRTDSNGNTLLHTAAALFKTWPAQQTQWAKRSALQTDRISCLLLHRGCRPTIKNKQGISALDLIREFDAERQHKYMPKFAACLQQLETDQCQTLKSLAAQCLCYSDIQFSKYLPHELTNFVNLY